MKRASAKDMVKGVDKLFVVDESTNTNDESSIESKSSVSGEVASTVTTESNVSVSTNTSGIPKKAKYLETRVQRSYYLDKDLVKELDKFAKKNDYDKSDIVNHLLREFLIKNGK